MFREQGGSATHVALRARQMGKVAHESRPEAVGQTATLVFGIPHLQPLLDGVKRHVERVAGDGGRRAGTHLYSCFHDFSSLFASDAPHLQPLLDGVEGHVEGVAGDGGQHAGGRGGDVRLPQICRVHQPPLGFFIRREVDRVCGPVKEAVSQGKCERRVEFRFACPRSAGSASAAQLLHG